MTLRSPVNCVAEIVDLVFCATTSRKAVRPLGLIHKLQSPMAAEDERAVAVRITN